jgi:hypothetical protein
VVLRPDQLNRSSNFATRNQKHSPREFADRANSATTSEKSPSTVSPHRIPEVPAIQNIAISSHRKITMITFLLLVLSISTPLLSEDITLRNGNECQKGHWVLSCNGTCQEGCEICNHITGKCADNTNNGTIIGTVNTNIITLQNNSYVTCVSANISSPIFVIPLITTVNEYTSSMLEKIDCTADNWILKNERVVGSLIVDKRWQDLSTITSNYQMFNSTKSISFSLYVYSVTVITIYINDKQHLDYIIIEIKNIKKWNHFAISLHNNNVYVFVNGQIIRTIVDFNPYEFVVKSTKDIFWKIHNYSSIWANRTTKEQPTVLLVPSIEKLSYVVFYVSLCKECFLEIVVNGTNNHTTSIYSRHESSSILKSWQEHVIEIQPFQETKIEFYRRTREFEDYGLWEVDIRWYSGKTQYR